MPTVQKRVCVPVRACREKASCYIHVCSFNRVEAPLVRPSEIPLSSQGRPRQMKPASQACPVDGQLPRGSVREICLAVSLSRI